MKSMPETTCPNGHVFTKTSECPVCPMCSKKEMMEKFGSNFPKIGAPAMRVLDSLGISKIDQLPNYSEAELLKLHGFGPKAIVLLKKALEQKNKSFKQT